MEADSNIKQQILIIEDDKALAYGLCRALQNEEIETTSCGTLKAAAKLLAKGLEEGKPYHLALLDVNLPDGSGFDFLQEIKKKYGMAVIILTANDMEIDVVTGLELGADDYVTKPFSLAVLRARVATQLRRLREWEQDKMRVEDDIRQQVSVIDDYRFDFARMEFYHGKEKVELSKTEQKLLRILVENKGISLKRELLLERIWSSEAEFVEENALSVTVKRLRDKLGAQDRIKTIYGIGYRFE